MNIKVLFSKIIALLFRESQINEDGTSTKLVEDIVQSVKINQTDVSGTSTELNDVKNLIMDMVSRATENPMTYQNINQQLKIILSADQNWFEAIDDDIVHEMCEDDIKRNVSSLRYELNKYLKTKKAQDLLEKITYNLKFKKDTIGNVDNYLSGALGEVTDLVSYAGEDMPGIIGEFDLSDTEKVAGYIDNIRKEADGSRVLKMPWQAMNRMTRGGLRLGQLTIVGGLGHNNKTGTCLSMFISACMFNNPKNLQRDPKKKPCHLLISFEDDLEIIVNNIYTLLKENFDNVPVTDDDKKQFNSREVARYIYDKLTSTGYEVKILRADPSTWSYREILNEIMLLQSQGYEIHLMLIDYLSLCNKEGLSNIRLDSDIQELFRRVKNFACATHNISLLVPHQLSPDALKLKRSGEKMLTKMIAGGSYYADCSALYREPELEILIDVVEDNGQVYQTFARGKHRGQNNTPLEHKFFILPFAKVGGLRFDINGSDTSITRFGAKRNANGDEELAVYDFGD